MQQKVFPPHDFTELNLDKISASEFLDLIVTQMENQKEYNTTVLFRGSFAQLYTLGIVLLGSIPLNSEELSTDYKH
jgi:hypothetical protein